MKDSIICRRQVLESSKTQENYVSVPPWLSVMYKTIFFSTCLSHQSSKKNELDHFCIDCLRPFCSNCFHDHREHNQVKIRRYIYSEVINRQDLCKLFNCSGIQTYHTNKAKVVFLKQRQRLHQQQQHSNTRDYSCIVCSRNLQESSLYCSIACKALSLYRDECKENIKVPIPDDVLMNEGKHEEMNLFQKDEDSFDFQCTERKTRSKRKGIPRRAPLF